MLNRFCLLDLETIGAPDADQWLGEVTPPANYSKIDTIEAYIRDERARRIKTAGLDADLCRIVVFGLQTEYDRDPQTIVATTEDAERRGLELTWQFVSQTRPMVGYGLTWFDAGVLVRRSQLLNVLVPSAIYQQGKYRHPMIVELADYLTLNGMIEQKKGRGLDYHCQRFGIHVDDPVTGKDVAALWAEGSIEAVRAHALSDIQRIHALAERLGVISRTAEHEEVA